VSLGEVAKRAGVSIATVSRVLNNTPGVRPETIKHVRKALSAVSYDTTAVRRGPRHGKRDGKQTRSIAVLVLGTTQEEWFRRPVFSQVVAGINRAANERGLQVLIDHVIDPGELNPSILKGQLNGALAFVRASSDPRLLDAVRSHLPVVRIMGQEMASDVLDFIGPDDLAVGRLAFRYLVERGCKHVAYVTTRADHEAMVLRSVGLRIAASQSQLAEPQAFICSPSFVTGPANFGSLMPSRMFSGENLESIAEAIAKADPRPDGLFVSQDAEMIGLYPMLVHHGIRPGVDVQIISCNNEQSGLQMLSPRPATIDLGTDQIGRWAVTRLINRIARPADPPVRMLTAPTLVLPPSRTETERFGMSGL
jgi:DNA-binding LacI/PurR family transcriptional regulator